MFRFHSWMKNFLERNPYDRNNSLAKFMWESASETNQIKSWSLLYSSQFLDYALYLEAVNPSSD